MSATEEANRQWREKRFQHTCKKYDREMKPFSKLLDSEDGIISGMFVSLGAISFAVGKSKRAELDAALASASEATSISFKAWNVKRHPVLRAKATPSFTRCRLSS